MYDIYRVSDLNKYKLSIYDPIRILRNNEQIVDYDDLKISENSTIDDEVKIDINLSYIDIDESILDKLEYNINIDDVNEHRYGKIGLRIISASTLYGTKNYIYTKSGAASTIISPILNLITREIPSDMNEIEFESTYHPGIEYKTKIINNDIFEFFEFKYNDIYYIDIHNSENYGKLFREYDQSDLSSEPLSTEELNLYYRTQLSYFLDFNNYKLCSEQELNNLYS